MASDLASKDVKYQMLNVYPLRVLWIPSTTGIWDEYGVEISSDMPELCQVWVEAAGRLELCNEHCAKAKA